MGLFDWFTKVGVTRSAEAVARDREWEEALDRDALPAQVEKRLRDAGAGRTPWVASMTPAELLIARTHGCRPIATVSGTCWYSFGRSWTEGHAEGWSRALTRIGEEAYAAGANAVVDVQLRRIQHGFGSGMDFTLIGTAVKIDGLKPSPSPVIATVPALEFVRLLEMGIVPVGLAVGAEFEWLIGGTAGSDVAAKRASFQSQPIMVLTDFWERVRRKAIWGLQQDAKRQGNGVLAHINFGQLLFVEQAGRGGRDLLQIGQAAQQDGGYLGRHIVMGTVVDTPRNAPVPHHIHRVADMRDPSPLDGAAKRHNDVYSGEMGEGEGAI